MNKSESNLIAAIEGGNYDKSVDALKAFSALKSTTDEQSNDYYTQVQALKPEESEEAATDADDTSVEDDESGAELVEDESTEEESNDEEIKVVDITTCSLDELKQIADNNGIKYRSNAKEKGLIKAIQAASPEPKLDFISSLADIPRVEKRGPKPKSIERKALEDNLISLLDQAVNFNAQKAKANDVDSRFARRMATRLYRIKKSLIR